MSLPKIGSRMYDESDQRGSFIVIGYEPEDNPIAIIGKFEEEQEDGNNYCSVDISQIIIEKVELH